MGRYNAQFQGVGAHPWALERRNALARGVYNRLVEDGRFLKKKTLSDVKWCSNTMQSAGAFSAHQMVFCSNLVDLSGWEDKNEDLMFAQDTSLAGQFVQQWTPRVRAQGATIKISPIANCVACWLATNSSTARTSRWVIRRLFMKHRVGGVHFAGDDLRRFRILMRLAFLSLFKVKPSMWIGIAFGSA